MPDLNNSMNYLWQLYVYALQVIGFGLWVVDTYPTIYDYKHIRP